RDDPDVVEAEPRDCVAVRFARGHGITQLVRRLARRRVSGGGLAQRRVSGGGGPRRVERLLLRHELRLELLDGAIELLAFLQRLAVPAVLDLGDGEALAL